MAKSTHHHTHQIFRSNHRRYHKRQWGVYSRPEERDIMFDGRTQRSFTTQGRHRLGHRTEN